MGLFIAFSFPTILVAQSDQLSSSEQREKNRIIKEMMDRIINEMNGASIPQDLSSSSVDYIKRVQEQMLEENRARAEKIADDFVRQCRDLRCAGYGAKLIIYKGAFINELQESREEIAEMLQLLQKYRSEIEREFATSLRAKGFFSLEEAEAALREGRMKLEKGKQTGPISRFFAGLVGRDVDREIVYGETKIREGMMNIQRGRMAQVGMRQLADMNLELIGLDTSIARVMRDMDVSSKNHFNNGVQIKNELLTQRSSLLTMRAMLQGLLSLVKGSGKIDQVKKVEEMVAILDFKIESLTAQINNEKLLENLAEAVLIPVSIAGPIVIPRVTPKSTLNNEEKKEMIALEKEVKELEKEISELEKSASRLGGSVIGSLFSADDKERLEELRAKAKELRAKRDKLLKEKDVPPEQSRPSVRPLPVSRANLSSPMPVIVYAHKKNDYGPNFEKLKNLSDSRQALVYDVPVEDFCYSKQTGQFMSDWVIPFKNKDGVVVLKLPCKELKGITTGRVVMRSDDPAFLAAALGQPPSSQPTSSSKPSLQPAQKNSVREVAVPEGNSYRLMDQNKFPNYKWVNTGKYVVVDGQKVPIYIFEPHYPQSGAGSTDRRLPTNLPVQKIKSSPPKDLRN